MTLFALIMLIGFIGFTSVRSYQAWRRGKIIVSILLKDRPIKSGGETCCCGKAIFNRIARCNESTDGLSLHYDVCPACGFETYAHCSMAVKQERYDEWRAND